MNTMLRSVADSHAAQENHEENAMRSRAFLTVSALALASLATGVDAAPFAPRATVALGGPTVVLAQSGEVDTRPSESLSMNELRDRIKQLRRLAKDNANVGGVPAEQLLAADVAEVERRTAERKARNGEEKQEAQQPAEQAAPAQEAAPAEQKAEKPRRKQQQTEEAAPQQEQAAPAEQAQPEQQPEQAEKPRRKPKDAEAAEEQQPERAGKPRRKPVDQAEQPAQTEQPAVAEPEQPRRERDRRNPPVAGEQKPEAPAVAQPEKPSRPVPNLAAVDDGRPAEQLTDAQLRRRIRAASELIESDGIDRRQERRLRQMVEADTTELNRRISATTGTDVGNLDADREARKLLGDNRPANRLRDEQLRERVTQVRGVLALEGLDPRFERQLLAMLASDRQELRSRVAQAERPEIRIPDPQRVDRRDLRRRMFEERDARRDELRRPDYQIVIERRAPPPPRPLPTIAMAEAYDEDLERQLIAPPAAPIDRQYTMQEYRANPGLRTLMPGIEVDTVKFGFNEDFLREEEIYKLDRLGQLLERIVAGNPDEVFLIEGHTDLVGSDSYNGALSLRRAQAVKAALTEFYYIDPRNLEIAGYGEQFPRIPTEFEEPENRRVTVRRITPILYGSR